MAPRKKSSKARKSIGGKKKIVSKASPSAKSKPSSRKKETDPYKSILGQISSCKALIGQISKRASDIDYAVKICNSRIDTCEMRINGLENLALRVSRLEDGVEMLTRDSHRHIAPESSDKSTESADTPPSEETDPNAGRLENGAEITDGD